MVLGWPRCCQERFPRAQTYYPGTFVYFGFWLWYIITHCFPILVIYFSNLLNSAQSSLALLDYEYTALSVPWGLHNAIHLNTLNAAQRGVLALRGWRHAQVHRKCSGLLSAALRLLLRLHCLRPNRLENIILIASQLVAMHDPLPLARSLHQVLGSNHEGRWLRLILGRGSVVRSKSFLRSMYLLVARLSLTLKSLFQF